VALAGCGKKATHPGFGRILKLKLLNLLRFSTDTASVKYENRVFFDQIPKRDHKKRKGCTM